MHSNEVKKERALLASLIESEADERAFRELELLAVSAGAEVVGKITQKKDADSATLFGKGKLQEIKDFIIDNEVSVLICDNELSGTQMRNISDAVGVKVLDRSSLILDIFAMRAVSIEGKLQVELAMSQYNLPRLIGVSGRMAKYGGGIGMRGPGEKKLETDRRIIHKNIDDLTKKIEQLSSQRDLRRKKRFKNNQKTVALVGYTNAGKSSIMNLLSKNGGGNPEDKLFATLDPITRNVYIDEDKNYLLTDTVGFIDRLPHEFIDAFASTLEEARHADLLLHIIDASDPDLLEHYDTVFSVLNRLKIPTHNIINVFNKIDLTDGNFLMPDITKRVVVSALTGEGVEELRSVISAVLYGA